MRQQCEKEVAQALLTIVGIRFEIALIMVFAVTWHIS